MQPSGNLLIWLYSSYLTIYWTQAFRCDLCFENCIIFHVMSMCPLWRWATSKVWWKFKENTSAVEWSLSMYFLSLQKCQDARILPLCKSSVYLYHSDHKLSSMPKYYFAELPKTNNRITGLQLPGWSKNCFKKLPLTYLTSKSLTQGNWKASSSTSSSVIWGIFFP